MTSPDRVTPNDSPALTIERAELSDIPEIAPLFEGYRAFYGKEPALEHATAFLEDRMAGNESVVLVARVVTDGNEARGAIAGFAQLFRALSSLSLGKTMILNDLYVAPEWRRAGAARLLVNASIAHAKSEGALRLELSTQHSNTKARALYDSLGFVADDEFTSLSLPLRVPEGGSRNIP
ncbi:MAG: GNAT family N-acetyltransferase [Gemmatimonadaceae bacterium]